MKALITGASSGLGKEMAKILSEQEIELVLVAREQQKLEEVQKELKTKTQIICMDLSLAENCVELYKQVGDIDILINNAGFGTCGEFIETDLITELNMINTNVCAVHTLTKLFLQDMCKKNSGYILNVASIAGFMPGPLMSTYYATKAYVVRLSEGIREELKKEKSNVKISILCPGPVNTNFNKVANVKFYIREADSMDVAKYAIKKLQQGKFYIVPGIDVKIAKIGAKIIPTPIISKITYKIQKRKLER